MSETTEIPKRLEEYVEIRDKEIYVKWRKLAKLKRKYGLEGQGPNFSSIFDTVLEFLESLGRLTHQKISSFYLACGGFDFGPKFSWAQDSFSFSTREDAKAFGSHLIQSVDLYKVVENGMYEILERGVNQK